jgi:hypothetical protein
MSMMRHLLTFFLISFFTIGGYAQPLNSVYYEDFTSATKDWLTGSNDTRILSILMENIISNI